MPTVQADGRRFKFRKMQYLNHDCIFKIYLRFNFTQIICIILNKKNKVEEGTVT